MERPRTHTAHQRSPSTRAGLARWSSILLLVTFPTASALHHMKRAPLQYVNRRDDTRPLTVTNQCGEDIYPGIGTQAGTGPSSQGFKLSPGSTSQQSVSADWQGRVWGRTNCSFNAAGTGPSGNSGGGSACTTGDCGGTVNCIGTGVVPVTLAEFTLSSSSGQTFYDISLVDGYNLPLAIVSLYPQSSDPALAAIPPNLMNPICIGTAALLGGTGSTADAALGSNNSYQIPLENTVSESDVSSWCPWDLQLLPPTKPGDGVYPYPDDDIQRPAFDPCYSACAKSGDASDCCTGKYDSPSACKPSEYSQSAKSVCPDAYSYAFDDQTSTFILPSGGGFEVVFCPPGGRSSNILKTLGSELDEVATTGHVSSQLQADTQNVTLIKSKNAATKGIITDQMLFCWAGLMVMMSFLLCRLG